MKKVAVIMGSASDEAIAREAAQVLKDYSVPYAVKVCSAHRSPDALREFVGGAAENGYGALICIAGMAAHLAGAAAALTVLPVIGVPVASGGLGGIDALLSTAQMPSGVPVATVAVNGGRNAALLAVEILAVTDSALSEKLRQARDRMRGDLLQKDEELAARLGAQGEEEKA